MSKKFIDARTIIGACIIAVLAAAFSAYITIHVLEERITNQSKLIDLLTANFNSLSTTLNKNNDKQLSDLLSVKESLTNAISNASNEREEALNDLRLSTNTLNMLVVKHHPEVQTSSVKLVSNESMPQKKSTDTPEGNHPIIELSTVSASVCDYIDSDDKNRLRVFLKTNKLKLRKVVKSVTCGGDNLLLYAVKNENLIVSKYIVANTSDTFLADTYAQVSSINPEIADLIKDQVSENN